MGFRCVQCSFPIKSLYVQYSPGNIRLMKCENCKAVADEYIECEIMILVIDLILHKPKAYRHLLYNVLNQQNLKFGGLLWKLAVIFLFFDAYKCLILESSKGNLVSSISFSSIVSTFWKMLMDVFFGNFMFIVTFLFMIKIFLHTSISISRCNGLLLALLISCYFKLFLIAMMVWEFPTSVIFIIELFCLSSNAVALKANAFWVNKEGNGSQRLKGMLISPLLVVQGSLQWWLIQWLEQLDERIREELRPITYG